MRAVLHCCCCILFSTVGVASLRCSLLLLLITAGFMANPTAGSPALDPATIAQVVAGIVSSLQSTPQSQACVEPGAPFAAVPGIPVPAAAGTYEPISHGCTLL